MTVLDSLVTSYTVHLGYDRTVKRRALAAPITAGQDPLKSGRCTAAAG